MTIVTNSSAKEPTSCPACGEDNLTLVREEVVATSRSGAAVRFLDEWTHCEACGEDFFTYEQSLSHSRARTAALRAADCLLSPERIRAARVSLGMTQEEFERALGVGRKTVVRWERGTVPPSKAANGMLWLAEKYPSVFLEYATEYSPKGGLRTDLTKVIHELVEMTPDILETTGEFAAVTGDQAKLFKFDKQADNPQPAAIENGGAFS